MEPSNPSETVRVVDSQMGICPVCAGARIVLGRSCRNCGGQYQIPVPTGTVRLDTTGQPCKHEYQLVRSSGDCYRVYCCPHCGDRYDEDSGD